MEIRKEEFLTPIKWYRHITNTARHTSERAIVLMKYYCGFVVFEEEAQIVCDLCHDALTDKECGRCFCWYDGIVNNEYGHKRFEFGVHNLEKVTKILVENGYIVPVADYIEDYSKPYDKRHPEIQEAAHKQRLDDWNRRQAEEQKEEKKKQCVQLSMFDQDGFY